MNIATLAISCLFVLFCIVGCSRTDFYVNRYGDIRSCSAEWGETISHIKAASYLRECRRSNVAVNYLPVNMEVGHVGIIPDKEYEPNKGYKVEAMIDGSAAVRAGINIGDYLYKINNELTNDYDDLIDNLGGDSKQVKLEIFRNNETKIFDITKRKLNVTNIR